jgi:hypothetical protein
MIDEQILERIKFLSKGLTEEDVKEFGQIMESSISEEDARFLPDLFLLFDDDWTSEGIIYPLLHAVELFEVTFYVKTFLETLKDSYGHAPESMEWLFIRMLNDDSYLKVIKENIHLADKETFLALLDARELGALENNGSSSERQIRTVGGLRALVNK